MRITAIEHVQLAMPPGGEARARAFYGGVLGLAEVPKPPHLASRGGCWFASEGVAIHLGIEADFRPASKAHLALRVEGLAGLVEHLRRHGFPPAEDEPLEGFHRVYVRDPFGNRLELLEPSSKILGPA
jgi:catechol 2,3-dioxygenase-like lactoylglutathione lyase family enzyme